MRRYLIILMVLVSTVSRAQHCPWDCSGMILVKTDVSRENVYKLSPVIVDENKKIIVDTIYGTGKDTYDSCKLLYYDDFLAYRIQRTALHYWYGYDTMYHFAEGYYVIKINYCGFSKKNVFLRLNNPSSNGTLYNYIEIPASAFIHLHDYNMEIRGGKSETIREGVKGAIINMNCEKWMLPKEDCN
jgi:hypothetical protein